MSRRGFTILSALLLLVAIQTLSWPMGRDQGIFAWAGEVILHGGVPYRDAWEVKGPAAHYTAALAIALFGHNEWSIHLLDLLLTAAGMVVLWSTGRRLGDRFAAQVAVVIYLLWYWGLGYWHGAQPDASLGIFQLMAMCLLLTNDPPIQRWRLAAAGACVAIAALYKSPYAACVMALIPAAWTAQGSFKNRLASLLTGIGGFTMPMLLTALWFAHRHALADLLDVQLIFNGQIHRISRDISLSEQLRAIIGFFTVRGAIFLLSAILIGFAHFNEKSKRNGLIVFLMLLVDLGCVAAQLKYFPYHWIPLFGPLALLVGLAAYRLRSALQALPQDISAFRVLRQSAVIVFVAAFLWSTEGLIKPMGLWLASVAHLRSWDAYHRSIAGQTYMDQKQVAQYIAQRTTPADTLLQWGLDPLINYLADREAPTRFGFNYALVRARGAILDKWRGQFMRDLIDHPPAYLVIVEHDENPIMPKASDQYIAEFPEFQRYIQDRFVKETQIGDHEIWRRKSPVP